MKPRILIVDDEETIRYFLRLELEQQGYEVWDAPNGNKALSLLKTHAFNVALVDLRLPDISGQDIMRHLNRHSPQTSIIIMTAYATLDSAIDAVKYSAHDYILKPFQTDEVLASIADGIARQNHPLTTQPDELDRLVTGPLSFDPKSHQIYLKDNLLKLTPTEHDLLLCFMKSPNTALDSVTLLQTIRGYTLPEEEALNIVRVHIHRLRQKLGTAKSGEPLIATVQGGRYLLDVSTTR